jgi:hypothetical protein
MQRGSMFITNCYNTLHVSDGICFHPQEHLKNQTQKQGSISVQDIAPADSESATLYFGKHETRSESSRTEFIMCRAQGRTVKQHFYLGAMRRLRDAVCCNDQEMAVLLFLIP